MRYNYKGFWSDSFCDIEVHRRTDGKYVFVATELRDNPGTSVTNSAEHLATAMCKQHSLKPEDVIWIEPHLESKGHRKKDLEPMRLTVEGASFCALVWIRVN